MLILVECANPSNDETLPKLQWWSNMAYKHNRMSTRRTLRKQLLP